MSVLLHACPQLKNLVFQRTRLHLEANKYTLQEGNVRDHISPDAFIGLTTLITLRLDNNYLHSLEILTSHNELTSFLYPLNQTLNTLDLSKNFLHDFKPIQNLSSLKTLGLSYNQIKHLDEFAFKKAQQLKSIDLSFNHIESIHPFTFNGTIVEYLDLSSNLFSSLETTKIIYDQQFKPKNQTISFLDSITSTLITLSLANCTNLLEINWFVFTKLSSLMQLDLSEIPKTDKFWYLQSRYENNSTIIHWDHYLPKLKINFNSIQFNNYDYCLSKSIFQIFNRTRLFIDDNHPCNCFVYMLKQKLDSETYPSCLLNQSTIDQLAQECINMDFTCFSWASSTTQLSSSTSSSSLTSTLTSTTTRITESSSSSTRSSSISSSSTLTSTTTKVTESISSLTTLITTTKILTTLGTRKDDGKWKTILAIMIPLTIIVIILALAGIYIVKRRKNKNSKETIEMDGAFVNIFAKK
ncbi:hypothetical protein I4U23_031531 [Adineta vaga]|nr:hypothetical protein I4U23_031531 [Adineta vaga]